MECSICLLQFEINNLNDKSKLPHRLQCSHVYHKSCIEQWYDINKQTCPLCKEKINSKNDIKYDSVVTELLRELSIKNNSGNNNNNNNNNIVEKQEQIHNELVGENFETNQTLISNENKGIDSSKLIVGASAILSAPFVIASIGLTTIGILTGITAVSIYDAFNPKDDKNINKNEKDENK